MPDDLYVLARRSVASSPPGRIGPIPGRLRLPMASEAAGLGLRPARASRSASTSPRIKPLKMGHRRSSSVREWVQGAWRLCLARSATQLSELSAQLQQVFLRSRQACFVGAGFGRFRRGDRAVQPCAALTRLGRQLFQAAPLDVELLGAQARDRLDRFGQGLALAFALDIGPERRRSRKRRLARNAAAQAPRGLQIHLLGTQTRAVGVADLAVHFAFEGGAGRGGKLALCLRSCAETATEEEGEHRHQQEAARRPG